MTPGAQIQRLGKDTFFYGVGMAVQNFAGFLLFPIYTRVLSRSEVGAQDLIAITTMMVTAVLSMGMDSATGRFYFDAETPAERRKVVSTLLTFTLLTTLPVIAILVVLATPITGLLGQEASLANPLRIALAVIPVKLLAQAVTLDLRLTFRSRQFSLVTGAGALGQGLGAVIFLIWLRMGLEGVFLASLLGTLFQLSMGAGLSWRHFQLRLSTEWLWPMLRFGVQLVPVTLSVWIMNGSNRYFLVGDYALTEIALLGAATKIVAIVTFLVSAFQISWGPFSYSLMHQRQYAAETYSRALVYFLLVTVTGSGLLSIFGREALRFLATPLYEQAAGLIPWLCAASICWGSGYIVGTGASIVKKSYHTSIATVLGATTNLGLNLVLIPVWGVQGAGVASAAGAGVMVLWRYYSGQKYFPVKYPGGQMAGLIGLAGLASVGAVWIDQIFSTWQPAALIWKAGLAFVFLAGVLSLRIVRGEEIQTIRGSLRRKAA